MVSDASEPVPVTVDDEREVSLQQRFARLWRRRGLALMFMDACTVFGTFMVAYYLRFHVEFMAIKRVPIAEAGAYVNGAGLLTILWIIFLWLDRG